MRRKAVQPQLVHEETLAAEAVEDALEHLRSGGDDQADRVIRHAVHMGARPARIARLLVERTGGGL